MSRIGKKVISVPTGVTVELDKKTRVLTVKGSLGQLQRELHKCISLKLDGAELNLNIANTEEKQQNAIWGTTRSIVANMVDGVTKGFNRELELNGVGYRMELAGSDQLVLHIGFSHPVKVEVPTGIKLTLNKNLLSGNSIDKELIGNFFSNIFHLKPCDVYKQKGFKVPGQFYRKKVVKKGK